MENSFKIFLLILSGLTAIGCASIRDTHQIIPVACNTPKCTVRIEETNQSYKAPTLIDVERDRNIVLKYSYQGEEKTQKVTGDVRWLESVFPNSLMYFLGPSGWIFALSGLAVDYSLGNMWELKDPAIVEFKKENFKPEIERLVLAPIKANSQLESDEAVKVVSEILKSKYPNAHIETPEEHLKEFERANWDYKSEPNENWKKFELYASLKCTHVVFAEVNRLNSNDRTVLYEVRDVLRKQTLVKDQSSFTSTYTESRTSLWAKSKMIDLIPNSLSLAKSTVNPSGFAFEASGAATTNSDTIKFQYYTLDGSEDKNSTQNEWGLSLSNWEQNIGRRFSFVFKWATEASLRHSTVYARRYLYTSQFNLQTGELNSNSSESTVAKMEQYFFGGAIGPEVGVTGTLGYFYLNLLYGAEYFYADITTNSKHINEIYSPMKVGFGYKIILNDKFHLGLEYMYRVYPSWVTDKLMTEAINQRLEGTSASEVRTVLSLTYHIPEMKSFGRKKMRNMISHH